MKYDLGIKSEKSAAFRYFVRLANGKKTVEIKRYVKGRSLNQNSYLHFLLGAFGEHFGYTLEESKTIYKREVNQGIYAYKKEGVWFLRSSADLNVEEMTRSIERFRQYSKDAGYPLPAADNTDLIRHMTNLIEQSSVLLKEGV
jgi:hypothetical protein